MSISLQEQNEDGKDKKRLPSSQGIGTAIFFLTLISAVTCAQNHTRYLLRFYLDNDFFACQKQDGAYTNGLRCDFFFEDNRMNNVIVPSISFHKGKHIVNTRRIGIMQLMFTPNNIRHSDPPANDYPYSGSIFVTHTNHSLNKDKRMAIVTEYQIGLMGPYSFARETQTFAHRALNNALPMGWHHQHPTTALFNINVAYETFLGSPFRFSEMIFKTEILAGTITNAIGFQTIMRFGEFSSYFENVIGRYMSFNRKRAMFYILVKPEIQFVKSNALLEGTVLRQSIYILDSKIVDTMPAIKSIVYTMDWGVFCSYHPLSFSFTYKLNNGLIKNQPTKSFGNVSVFIAI